jgi:hypothetical protein
MVAAIVSCLLLLTPPSGQGRHDSERSAPPDGPAGASRPPGLSHPDDPPQTGSATSTDLRVSGESFVLTGGEPYESAGGLTFRILAGHDGYLRAHGFIILTVAVGAEVLKNGWSGGAGYGEGCGFNHCWALSVDDSGPDGRRRFLVTLVPQGEPRLIDIDEAREVARKAASRYPGPPVAVVEEGALSFPVELRRESGEIVARGRINRLTGTAALHAPTPNPLAPSDLFDAQVLAGDTARETASDRPHGPRASSSGVARRGTVREEVRFLEGEVDEAQARLTVEKRMVALEVCAERAARKAGAFSGQVTVHIELKPDGFPAAVTVVAESVGEGKFLECLTRKVGRWPFPRPAGGHARLELLLQVSATATRTPDDKKTPL